MTDGIKWGSLFASCLLPSSSPLPRPSYSFFPPPSQLKTSGPRHWPPSNSSPWSCIPRFPRKTRRLARAPLLHALQSHQVLKVPSILAQSCGPILYFIQAQGASNHRSQTWSSPMSAHQAQSTSLLCALPINVLYSKSTDHWLRGTAQKLRL
jgi:hypothetical protein